MHPLLPMDGRSSTIFTLWRQGQDSRCLHRNDCEHCNEKHLLNCMTQLSGGAPGLESGSRPGGRVWLGRISSALSARYKVPLPVTRWSVFKRR